MSKTIRVLIVEDDAIGIENLLEGLITYTQIHQRNQPMKAIALNEIVEKVISNSAPNIRQARASISFNHLPMVHGNPEGLLQLFENLICNALEYGGEVPKVTIDASQKMDFWTISVSDNGPGIAEDKREGVFEPSRTSELKAHGGMSLGLPICKKIVKCHGGTIWVEANPNGGTTFAFTLKSAEVPNAVPAG